MRSNRRSLTPDERKVCQTKNPFHILRRSDKWQERKEAIVEVLEFDARKAWNLWGCNRGPACCPGGILVGTRDQEFIFLSGRVSSSDYHFSFQDSDYFDGTTVVIERWPKTKGIYRARFSGDPIEYVHISEEEPRWKMPPTLSRRLFTGPCEIISNETLKDLPEALRRELLAD